MLLFIEESLKDLCDSISHVPLPPPSDEHHRQMRKKIVLIYHDENFFNTNEGQTWFWGTVDEPYIQPKMKGRNYGVGLLWISLPN